MSSKIVIIPASFKVSLFVFKLRKIKAKCKLKVFPNEKSSLLFEPWLFADKDNCIIWIINTQPTEEVAMDRGNTISCLITDVVLLTPTF